MKKWILVLTALFLTQAAFAQGAFVTNGTILCVSNGESFDAQSEEGHFECAAALTQGEGACFTGSASKVVDLINSDAFNWDEEWLEGARVKGNDKITYKWVDGPNEISDSLTLKRCTGK